jgi:uncharacterized protein DUF6790
MITEQNFSPGNAGIIFWSDIIVPVIGFDLLVDASAPAPICFLSGISSTRHQIARIIHGVRVKVCGERGIQQGGNILWPH